MKVIPIRRLLQTMTLVNIPEGVLGTVEVLKIILI
jgi:hypothetical protein